MAAVLVGIAVAACSSADTATPVPDDGAALFDGRDVTEFFRSNCSSCHGRDRGGGIGPSLRPDDLTEADSFYFETIAHGRGSMPAWRAQGVRDREIEALIEFLRRDPP